MPNHVLNQIQIKANKALLKKIQKTIKSDNDTYCAWTIDFDKIIKRPEELDMSSGSVTTSSLRLYLTCINPEIDYFGDASVKVTPEEYEHRSKVIREAMFFMSDKGPVTEDELSKYSEEELEKELSCGQRYWNNIEQYGYPTWYEWDIANWGTKWNAYDFAATDDDGNVLEFNTAWSPSLPVTQKLSAMFPDAEFKHSYTDESLGYTTGYEIFQAGVSKSMCRFEDGSPEAVQYAMQLYGMEEEDLQNYSMFLSYDGTAYLNYPEYKTGTYKGQKCMWAEIDELGPDKVPAGYYYYGFNDTQIMLEWLNDLKSCNKDVKGFFWTKQPIDMSTSSIARNKDDLILNDEKEPLNEYEW